MSLGAAIAATYQTVGFVVRVAGQQVPDVLEVSVSAGFDQINANAQLTCAQRPAWAEEGAAVEIYAVLNGIQAQLFAGQLSGIGWSFFPGTVTFDVRDTLSRTRLAWGGPERVYTNQDDAAIIRNLLEACGIPSSQANIESSGWTLGVVQEVTLATGDVPYSLIERIDSLSGYRTFSLSNGIIVRRRVDGRASYTPAYSYTEGENILGIRRRRGIDGIVNKAEVTGLTYEGLGVTGTAAAPNSYIPTPPGTISERVQDDLIETDARANLIAARIVADKNRRPDGFEMDASINPGLQPGMTISVSAPNVEAANARVLIENVRHAIGSGGATTSIKTTGGAITGYAAGFPPIAAFDVKLFRESLDTGGTAVTPIVVGIADGAGSYDTDGTITAYAWSGSVTGGTATPGTASGPVYRFVATGGSAVTITLAVTDNDGLAGTIIRGPLAFDAGSVSYEALYTAEEGIIAYSGDGQATWNQGTITGGTVTCLAPFAPAWGEIWGKSNGEVLASLDGLTTPPQSLGTIGPAAVTAVWVHETDTSRLWAALANGAVYGGVFSYSGTVGTAVWTPAGTVPASPVNEIRESVGVLGELRATAGSAEWKSSDAGRTWAAVLSGAGTAWRMAAGWERNAASFLGAGTASPVRYEEGGDPAFSPAIGTVRGVGMGWRQPELYAADGGTAATLYLDAGFSGSATPAGTAPTRVNHLIRSGNEDRVVYLAGDAQGGTIGGVLKWIPEVLPPAYIRRTGSRNVRMVGYGTPVNPRIPGRFVLVVLPFGASGADDRIWIYQTGAWRSVAPPSSGKFWRTLAVNPLNPNQWLLFGNSVSNGGGNNAWAQAIRRQSNTVLMADFATTPLWYSPDFGATWQAVALSDPGIDSGTGGDYEIYGPRWSSLSPGRWILPAFRRIIAGPPLDFAQEVIWRGTDATATAASEYSYGPDIGITPSSIGPQDDVIIASTQGSYVGYSPNGSTTLTLLGTVAPSLRWSERLGSGRGALFTNTSAAVFVTPDYRATLANTLSGASGAWATSDYTGAVYVGERSGIQRITNPLTSPTADIVAAAGVSVGRPYSDAQTRAMVAALRPGPGIQAIDVYDGAQWSVIPPPPMTAISLSPDMAIIAAP